MNTFLTLDQVRVGQRVRLEEVLSDGPDTTARPGDVVEVSRYFSEPPEECFPYNSDKRHYLTLRLPDSTGRLFWGRVSALESATPSVAGPSDFTPAQQDKIRTLALRYADEHGHESMVSQILAELGIPETPTPIRKRARITVTFETDLEGHDGFTLPNNPSRLNGMLLRTHAREAVEALIPSRIGLSDQVDIVSTSVSYLDTDTTS